MPTQLQRRLSAALLASTLLLVVGALPPPSAAASPLALADPPGAALDWVEGELSADGGRFSTSFDDGGGGVASFPDWGLTIDAILALAADGRGDGAPAALATDLVEDNVAAYVTGGDFGPDDRYAGALGKALLVAQVQGQDPSSFGGFDLVAELLARRQTDGPDAGRFSDLTGFGDFSNGFGQALAIMGLARTPAGPPEAAVDFLLDQQCPGGSFRGDYTAPGGCTSDEAASVDATGFALQALLTVEPTCRVRQAVTDATASLVEGQNPSGAFGGDTGSNTNSTGLAAVALRSLGQPEAPDAAAAFISDLQVEQGDDAGAIALNDAGLTAAADGVQVLERDGFRRATTQAVLAFGLPTYGEINAQPVDPTAFTPCSPEPSAPGAPEAPPSPPSSAPGVTPTGVSGGAATLPATGATTGGQAAAGTGLVMLGAVLVVVARRRAHGVVVPPRHLRAR